MFDDNEDVCRGGKCHKDQETGSWIPCDRHEAEKERAPSARGETAMAETIERCGECDEQPPVYRLSITDMDGVLLDGTALCADCAPGVFELLRLHVGSLKGERQ